MPNNRSFARSPKFWNYGFCIHLTVLALIATAAYLGILPTTYRAIPYYDLLGHALLIGLLAFFLDGLLRFKPLIPGKITGIRLAPVLILGLAALEEWGQSFSALRTASVNDFLADVVGIVLGSWAAKTLAVRHGVAQKSPADLTSQAEKEHTL